MEKQLAVAFRAYVPGIDEAEVPDCMVLVIDDLLRQKVLDAQTLTKQYGFDEIRIPAWFYTPNGCVDDDVEAAVAVDDCCVVDGSKFEDVDEQRVDCCEAVVLYGNILYLTCYDHYGDYVIESAQVEINRVLGATL